MIDIEISSTQILINVDGKEYYYPADYVELDFSRESRIFIREVSAEPLQAGELLWDFPAQYTIIHYIGQ